MLVTITSVTRPKMSIARELQLLAAPCGICYLFSVTDTQELARRFNEDEKVWRAFERKRAWRKLLRSISPLAEKILDDLDWQEAERKCREVRAVGFFYPGQP